MKTIQWALWASILNIDRWKIVFWVFTRKPCPMVFLSGLCKYPQSKPGIEVGNPPHCVDILPPSTDYFGVLDPIRKKHMVPWLIILVLFYQESCKHQLYCNILHKNMENVYIKKMDISARDLQWEWE